MNKSWEETNAMTPSKPASISDNDLCASCVHLIYNPGHLSYCKLQWPCENNGQSVWAGDISECHEFKQNAK